MQAAASEVSTTFRFTVSFLVQPVYNCLDSQGVATRHRRYPLIMTNLAVENHHVQWENPLQMVMFNSYVTVITRG